MNYQEKLKSPKWQKKRLEILNRDNFTCCACGDTETELHVHHLKYVGEPYDAPNKSLQTLCKYCHQYFTFLNKEYQDCWNEKLLKIHYIPNGRIAEFETIISLFFIEFNVLKCKISFKKNSKALIKISEFISNKK
jgi:hypothetical protein